MGKKNKSLSSFLSKKKEDAAAAAAAQENQIGAGQISLAEESTLMGVDFCPTVAGDQSQYSVEESNKAFLERVAVSGMVSVDASPHRVAGKGGSAGKGGERAKSPTIREGEELDTTQDMSYDDDPEDVLAGEEDDDAMQGRIPMNPTSPSERRRAGRLCGAISDCGPMEPLGGGAAAGGSAAAADKSSNAKEGANDTMKTDAGANVEEGSDQKDGFDEVQRVFQLVLDKLTDAVEVGSEQVRRCYDGASAAYQDYERESRREREEAEEAEERERERERERQEEEEQERRSRRSRHRSSRERARRSSGSGGRRSGRSGRSSGRYE